MKLSLTKFSMRHFKSSPDFKPDFAGTVIEHMSAADFESRLNSEYPLVITPGYAPFCRLHFYTNFALAKVGVVGITEKNWMDIESGYSARREGELPVLSRWVSSDSIPTAKYICVVTYDKDQLDKEGDYIEGDVGVVAVLAQDELEEQPMTPMTMMRNALGIAEGGSGVPLDREKYMKAVEFWDKHAVVSSVYASW